MGNGPMAGLEEVAGPCFAWLRRLFLRAGILNPLAKVAYYCQRCHGAGASGGGIAGVFRPGRA